MLDKSNSARAKGDAPDLVETVRGQSVDGGKRRIVNEDRGRKGKGTMF